MRLSLQQISFFTLIFFMACSYDFAAVEEEADDFGDVNFEKFYVIGGTFTSGYMDGALFDSGMQYSYPSIIGEKINTYFTLDIYSQAATGSDHGYNIFESDTGQVLGRYELKYRTTDADLPGRFAVEGELPENWAGEISSLKDFSIPALNIRGLLDNEFLSHNQYFSRLPIQPEMTILDIVIQNNPEIILFSVGLDDLLPAAISGLNSHENRHYEFLSGEQFGGIFDDVMDRLLTETDANIFVINLFDFTEAPFFNALPYYFNLGQEVTEGDVNGFASFYQDFNRNVNQFNFGNGGVPEEQRRPNIDFDVNGGNSFRARVFYDESLPDAILPDGTEIPKIRQMQPNEYLLYSAEPRIIESVNFGSVEPITGNYVLRADQIELLKSRIDDFNARIMDVTYGQENIHLIDVRQKTEQISDGLFSVEGVTFNTGFTRNSIYSKDGYTLNPVGNAIIANMIIEELNRVLNINIRPVDIHNYKSLQFQIGF